MHEREKPRALENGQSSIITFWVARLRCESTFRRKMEPWKSLSRTCNIPTTNALKRSFRSKTRPSTTTKIWWWHWRKQTRNPRKLNVCLRSGKIRTFQLNVSVIWLASSWRKQVMKNRKSLQEFISSMDEEGWTFDTDDSVDSLFLSKQRCDAEKNRRL